MSRHVTVAMWLVSAGVVSACGGGSPPTPVPVSGSTRDMAALAGEWSGEYSSMESGRSGSIVFRLTAGTDSATGDVVMSAMTGGPRGSEESPQPVTAPTPPQAIAIRFVHIEHGRVSGRLEPYTEPTCQCQVVTVFDGQLSGSKFEGTYRTMLPDGRVQSGRWSVTRR